MGLYEHWPYTNFHELNLDWLVHEIQKWAADYAQIHDETEGMLAQINELKQYVDSYFDDLDIQTEINNKIDEMVENGTFEEIVSEYISNVRQDMVDQTYYDEISYEMRRTSSTTTYIVRVPRTDSAGNVIQMDVEKDLEHSPAVHARDTYSTLTVNGQLYMKPAVGDTWLTGNIISRGEAMNRQDITVPLVSEGIGYLTFSEDRLTVKEYPITTTMSVLLADNDVYTCFNYYAKIVDNGAAVDISNLVSNEGIDLSLADPQFAVGVKNNGDIVFIGCDGRMPTEKGLTAGELSNLFISEGCTRAWMLDGGGSTSINYLGSKLNKSLDGSWDTDRLIPWTVNFRKETINNSVAEGYSNTGMEKFQSQENSMPLIKNLFDRYKTAGGVDLNLQKQTCIKYVISGINTPPDASSTSGTLIVISREGAGQSFDDPEDVQQFYMSWDQPNFLYSRHYANDAWSGWSIFSGQDANRTYYVPQSEWVGLVYGDKIYLTIPISPVCKADNNATAAWNSSGGAAVYYDGHVLADSGSYSKFTIGYCRMAEGIGAVMRLDCGNALINDANYKNMSVVLVEIKDLFITMSE